MYQAPTRRELVLVLLLFTALLVFSSRFVSYKSLSHLDLSSVWHDVPPQPKTYSIPTLPSDTRVSWGTSKVPRTKIIAHVPGEHSSSDRDTCTLISTLPKDGLSLTRCTFTTAPYFLSVTNQEHSPIGNSSLQLEPSSTIVQKWSELACPPTMTCASSAQVQRRNSRDGAKRIQGVTVRQRRRTIRHSNSILNISGAIRGLVPRMVCNL